MSAERGAGAHDPLARYVFAALVLACFAAFFVTQRLKHTPTAVQGFKLAGRFAPRGPAAHAQEAISFELDHTEAITVTVVSSAHEHTVATLVESYRVLRYRRLSLRWSGREGLARRFVHTTSPDGHPILVPLNDGPLAPPGEYQVDVTLLGQGARVVPSPHTFRLEAG